MNLCLNVPHETSADRRCRRQSHSQVAKALAPADCTQAPPQATLTNPISPWKAAEEIDLALPNRCCATPGPSSAGFLAAAEDALPPKPRLPPNAGPLSARWESGR